MNEHTRKEIEMQDGFKVPIVCIEALEDLQEIWPGATTAQARAAIVRAVIQAEAKDDRRKWNELNSPSTPSKKLPEPRAWMNHSSKRL